MWRGNGRAVVAAGFALVLSAASALGAGSAPTLTPYVAFAWHTPARSLQHVVGILSYTAESDPAEIAADLKTIAPGERALMRWSDLELLLGSSNDMITGPDRKKYWGPWLANGSALEAAFEQKFMAALQQDGASVDYLVLDTEWSISNWSASQGQLNAIAADPRWPAISKAVGVNKISDICNYTLNADGQMFNLGMQETLGQFVHDGLYVPLTDHFPDAHCSDYGDGVLSASACVQAPDLNGWCQPQGTPMHGDTQAPAYYSQVGNIAQKNNQGANFSAGMPVMAWEISSIRAQAKSGVPIIFWMCGKTWTGGRLANLQHFDELVYHLMLSGSTTNVNLWDADNSTTQQDCDDMDAELASIQQATGNSPTLTTLTTAAIPYTSSVLVSGAKCSNGQRVYRVTATNTLSSSQKVTVTLPGETSPTVVTIPGGQCGTWVVHQ